MIGAICTITAEGEKNAILQYGPKQGNPLKKKKKLKIDRKLLKLSIGELVEFNTNNLMEMIEDDATLYAEFEKDSNRKKRVDEYILMYNQRNPIYLEN